MASDLASDRTAKFGTGQVVRHALFEYRGVIIDVDATFQGTDEWYEMMAKSRPPKDEPWYHVLVHDAMHSTYVAERNLEADSAPAPIRHPQLRQYFDRRVGAEDGRGGRYVKDDVTLQ
jgi:heat shock protein HspQ